MISRVKNLWESFQKPKIYVDIGIDHIELAETYLIFGIFFDWHNTTPDAVKVENMHLKLFNQGRRKEPINLMVQGNFDRVPGERVITKSTGVKPFTLPAKGTHLVGVRFFTRSILDIDEGTYPVEIHAKVPGGTYLYEADLKVTTRVKYRTSEEWTGD